MSQTKTKEELVRLAWQTEMRRNPHRQCRGATDSFGKVCAMILLAEMTSPEGDWMSTYRLCNNSKIFYGDMARRAGLSGRQGEKVIRANDSGRSFASIADMIDSWFPSR